MGNRLVCCRYGWYPLQDALQDPNSIVLDPKYRSYIQQGLLNEGYLYTKNIHENEFYIRDNPVFEHDDDQAHVSVEPSAIYNCAHVSTTIQHISEREPEDSEVDPSLNVRLSSLFLSELPVKRRYSGSFVKYGRDYWKSFELRRWSSCSTVYISRGCLAKPDQNYVLHCIALAIAMLVGKQPEPTAKFYEEAYREYDERRHRIQPSSCPRLSLRDQMPSSTTSPSTEATEMMAFCRSYFEVQRFLAGVFHNAHIGPQCAIMALVLLERLLNENGLHLQRWSWRRMLFACILIASKILDDQAVWNVDYCQILRDVHVNDLNTLERHTLKLLQFSIDVSRSVYARYFFDLLELGDYYDAEGGNCAPERLTGHLAVKLNLLPSRPGGLDSCSHWGDCQLFGVRPPLDPVVTRCFRSPVVKHLPPAPKQADKPDSTIHTLPGDEFEEVPDDGDDDYAHLLRAKQKAIEATTPRPSVFDSGFF